MRAVRGTVLVVYSTGNLFRVFTNVVGFSHLYEIGQHADVDIGRICRKQSWAQRSACTWGATGLPLVPQTHERRDTGGLLHTGMNFRVALMITFSSKRCRRRQSVLGLPRAPLYVDISSQCITVKTPAELLSFGRSIIVRHPLTSPTSITIHPTPRRALFPAVLVFFSTLPVHARHNPVLADRATHDRIIDQRAVP
jgi:hypothetical protein